MSAASRTLLATGVMQALVEIGKRGHRETLQAVMGDVLSRVLAITHSGTASEDGASGVAGNGAARTGPASAARSGRLQSSSLLRKLLVKLATRTGLAYLPPRLVSWRYQRGNRSLLRNLSAAGVASATTAIASNSKAATSEAAAAAVGGVEDEDIDIPPQMEDIIDMLLRGLRDTDTVVRWSAAKGGTSCTRPRPACSRQRATWCHAVCIRVFVLPAVSVQLEGRRHACPFHLLMTSWLRWWSCWTRARVMPAGMADALHLRSSRAAACFCLCVSHKWCLLYCRRSPTTCVAVRTLLASTYAMLRATCAGPLRVRMRRQLWYALTPRAPAMSHCTWLPAAMRGYHQHECRAHIARVLLCMAGYSGALRTATRARG
ncbi:MAG: hypothetical protein EOO41_05100, partial [Methanobacteriota archaeon]